MRMLGHLLQFETPPKLTNQGFCALEAHYDGREIYNQVW